MVNHWEKQRKINMVENGLFSFDDPIFNERNGKKALYIDRDLLNDLKVFAKENSKCHQNIAEYALKLLIHSNNQKVQLDVDSL